MTPQTAPQASGESLFAAVSGWAAHASIRRLEQLFIITLGLSAVLMVARLTLWPLAALSGTVAMVAAWGLIDHRQQAHPTSGLRAAERLCVVLGILLAIVTAIGLLFWVLSSGWSTTGG